MAYTNNDLLNIVNFAIRQENKGNPITRNNFTTLLDSKGFEYFEMMYDEYEKTQELTDSLRRFKETKQGGDLTFTGNTINIPATYAHKGFLYYKKDGTTIKPVYIVDDDRFMMLQDSYIDAPSEDYPIARFITDYIEYLPTTLNKSYFTFSYLRYPVAPKYDYYIDANGVTHYLAAGATHTWASGETDSSGVVHTTGTYTSLTVELDFNEEDKLKIVDKIIQAVSVPVNDGTAYQYAEQLKMES